MGPDRGMSEKPDLQSAYALDGKEANKRLYAAWAETYDTDFATENAYLSPLHVARAFAASGGRGPVLDLGAGTGLVGEALAELGIGPCDGTDLSAEMLAVAEAKDVYRRCFTGDMLDRLPVADGAYAGVVCAGTFTHGHVGPEALAEVLRCGAPGARFALSVNAAHWEARGFAATFRGLGSLIEGLETPRLPIYGAGVQGDHAGDEIVLATFTKGKT